MKVGDTFATPFLRFSLCTRYVVKVKKMLGFNLISAGRTDSLVFLRALVSPFFNHKLMIRYTKFGQSSPILYVVYTTQVVVEFDLMF